MVYAICLTADRPAMTDRAIRSFVSQTYAPRRMLLLDTGIDPYPAEDLRYGIHQGFFPQGIQHVYIPGRRGDTIGALRNCAAELAIDADILVHWDSDDWSSPHRMLCQVRALDGKDAVDNESPRLMTGYNAMVFWDSTRGQAWEYQHGRADYALGTSLAYWRETWKAREFGKTSCGEEIEFTRTRCVSESAIPHGNCLPMLVAEIHGRNTSSRIIEGVAEWRRAEWRDEKIGRLMQL